MRHDEDLHRHCVTPCDSMRIQQDNHNANLDLRTELDAARDEIRVLKASATMKIVAELRQELDDYKDIVENCCGPAMTQLLEYEKELEAARAEMARKDEAIRAGRKVPRFLDQALNEGDGIYKP